MGMSAPDFGGGGVPVQTHVLPHEREGEIYTCFSMVTGTRLLALPANICVGLRVEGEREERRVLRNSQHIAKGSLLIRLSLIILTKYYGKL